MGRVELCRVEAFWDGAANGELFKLVLNDGKMEKMKKRGLSLRDCGSPVAAVALSDTYEFNELVHRRKSRTPSNDVSSKYLGVLVRLDE